MVATPIGHLDDASARCLDTLAKVDVIAAEDTRRSKPLLRHFGIATPCIALHEHNEREMTPRLIGRLAQGEAVALISDAGTPLISDPGYHLVRAAQDAGRRVVPVPGPSALITALSASGLPAERFVFEGFLPSRAGARLRHLESLREETRTLIFYEAPHRVLATLQAMMAVFGPEREAAYARELTKVFETLRRDELGRLVEWVRSDPDQQRGEIVILVRGAVATAEPSVDAAALRTLAILQEALPMKQAVALAARLTGVNRNRLYQEALRLKEE